MPHTQNNTGVDLSATAIAEVIHELRAPLGGIEAMAGLLCKTDMTPEQDKLVRGLMAAATHLRAVANDVLDGAAASKHGLGIHDDRFHLHQLVQSIAVSAESRAGTKAIKFATVMDDRLSEQFVGDARRIRQMLENLLDNAMKVTSAGSITLSVEHVDRRGQFEGLKFTVADTGPGFSAEEQKKLFRSYGRLANGVNGTGLGLSLVRRLAQAMGGEAGCKAVQGRGAQFWFTLRLKTSARQDVDTTPDTVVNAIAKHDTQVSRILVVDDNPANRMIMAAILEHFGYQTAEAESGESALDLLAHETFSAIMLDQTLPGMSGVETLLTIRAMSAPMASIPVIPVTGRVSSADRKAFAQAGANGFVEKPVTARAVRDAIQDALMLSCESKRSAA